MQIWNVLDKDRGGGEREHNNHVLVEITGLTNCSFVISVHSVSTNLPGWPTK